MIIGIFFRHYKCYKGARFLPFSIDKPQSLNVFIGNNGAGKSSVLEALDTFFNNRDWTIHYDSKKSESFVAPLFLYEKAKVENIFSKQSLKNIEIINNALWNIPINSNSNYKKYYEPYFELRDKLIHLRETHYIFSFTKEFDNNLPSFLPFDKYIKDAFTEEKEKITPTIINKLKDEFLNKISYLYIPVETSISEFLRLETKGMQDLMNFDIKQSITNALSSKRITRGGGTRAKQLSLLDIINENLEGFISDIEKTIQKIDSEYNFTKEYKSKIKLTANHVTNVIIESYFAKRRLKKSQKSIVNLSAGERKRALIDIAYTFLNHSSENDKEIILAIDEPESSLHISQCYEQFNKINIIAEQLGVQVLLTTHWYGSLPIFRDGVLHHINAIDDIPVSTSFNLSNYFEERGSHPDDIHLKSFYDLSSSILSSLRLHNSNWLLVEGNEDRKYLEYYLEDSNCKVLPLGGCTIVKIIYEYLYLPLSQKNEVKNITGKVFCLIDTDKNGIKLNTESENKDNNLKIRRLQFNDTNSSIVLKRLEDDYKSATEIEESLDSLQFYTSLAIAIDQKADVDTKIAFDNFEFDENVQNSFIKGDYSILNHLGNGRNIRTDKELISKFIDQNKKMIAEEYIFFKKENIPNWIQEIKKYFQEAVSSDVRL